MAKREFTEDEVRELVYESIKNVEHDSSRWTAYMSSIIKCEDDGKFYELFWDRGLTEEQENEFEAQEAEEVVPRDVYHEPHYTKEYLPLDYRAPAPYKFELEDLKGSPIVEPGSSIAEALEAIENFDTREILDFLDFIQVAMVKPEDRAYFASAVAFFKGLNQA